MTITEFLLARIAEDERRAPRKRVDYWQRPCPLCGKPADGLGSPLDNEAVRVHHDPDLGGIGCPISMDQWQELMPDMGPSPSAVRVLAECEAKRVIVGLHADWHVCPSVNGKGCTDYSDGSGEDWEELCPTLRALALPYADHPDYRDEWRS